jgi:prepilin-type N-terminal cleavage/methylation domain-containing protein
MRRAFVGISSHKNGPLQRPDLDRVLLSACTMSTRGFTLIETLVALSLAVVGLSALAHLFVLSVQANADARRATFASVLAAQKMEQLRGLGPDLSPQAGAPLSQNIAGLCDFLDEYGRSLGTGSNPPAGTVYVRRWSIESMPGTSETLLVQVVVIPRTWRAAAASGGSERAYGGARLVTVKTRRAG